MTAHTAVAPAHVIDPDPGLDPGATPDPILVIRTLMMMTGFESLVYETDRI